ncbi:hypothetical protein ACP70R_019321 [Stipagrostis hirtigluma subsp. patula]
MARFKKNTLSLSLAALLIMAAALTSSSDARGLNPLMVTLYASYIISMDANWKSADHSANPEEANEPIAP